MQHKKGGTAIPPRLIHRIRRGILAGMMKNLDQMADQWVEYLLDENTILLPEEWEYIKNNASRCRDFAIELWASMEHMSQFVLVTIQNAEQIDDDIETQGYRMFRKNIDKWKRIMSIADWKTGKIDHENGPEPSVPF